ncbi:MAG: tyrosine-type recombinase/integrase [Phycisphaerae bacterium]|nr:tyrosine-type recombinase/integrase [Phycisphaerae bacterium]
METASDITTPASPTSLAVVTPADQHPVAVYLARLGEGSRRTMKQALDTMAALVSGGRADAFSLPWSQLGYQHVQALRAALAERYAPANVNKMLAALRGVLKESWKLGQMSAEAYHRVADVQTVRGSRLPVGRMLTHGEVAALVAACQGDPTATGRRDAALLAVLFSGGLRRAEVVALKVDSYKPETGELRVSGKGRKERLVYLTNGAAKAVEAWLAVRGAEAGPLFYPTLKGGQIVREHGLSPQSVLDILRKLASKAGVGDFSPHDLRRTFVSGLLDAGADLVAVQALAGHASPTTTARYDRRGERAKQDAASRLHFPFAG